MTSLVASAALSAAAEGGGGGLTDIDTGLFIWTLVMFAVFAGILAKFAWGPLLKIIDEPCYADYDSAFDLSDRMEIPLWPLHKRLTFWKIVITVSSFWNA